MKAITTTSRLLSGISVSASPDMIAEVAWFAGRSKDVLSDVYVTLAQQEDGAKLAYGLDFDIIFAYANPWARSASHSYIIQFLIEQDTIPLLLLPGTVEELFVYLKHARRQRIQAEELRRRLTDGHANDATIEAAMSLCAHRHLGMSAMSARTDLNFLSQTLMEFLHQHDVSLKRLNRLICSGRLVDLDSIRHEPDAPAYDQELAHSLFVKLTGARPGMENIRRNKADAKNIACVIQHAHLNSHVQQRQTGAPQDTVLRLLTNTRCILNLNIESYYDRAIRLLPSASGYAAQNLPHSLAVTTCFEAAYGAALRAAHPSDVTASRSEAGKQLSRAMMIGTLLQIQDTTGRDAEFSGDKDAARRKEVVDRIIPDCASEIVNDKWYSTISYLLDLDARERESKGSDPARTERWWEYIDDVGIVRNGAVPPSLGRADVTKIEMAGVSDKAILPILGISSRDINLVASQGVTRWVLENTLEPRGDAIVVFETDERAYYLSWPCAFNEPQVIQFINALFSPPMGLLATCGCKGKLAVTLRDRNDVMPLCDLPLESPLNTNDYHKLLKRLKANHEVPTEIWCDADACSIMFTLVPVHDKPGILFGFGRASLANAANWLFRQTSPWAAGEDKCSTAVGKRVEEELSRRVCGDK